MEKTFGSTLKEKRREANMTQRELASEIGLDFSYISKIENDRVPPPAADTVVAICEALDVSPEELLALTGKIPTEIQDSIARSQAAQEFLQKIKQMDLSDSEWRNLKSRLQGLREE